MNCRAAARKGGLGHSFSIISFSELGKFRKTCSSLSKKFFDKPRKGRRVLEISRFGHKSRREPSPAFCNIQDVSGFSSLSLRRLISVPFSSAPIMRMAAVIYSQIIRTMTVPMEPYSRE